MSEVKLNARLSNPSFTSKVAPRTGVPAPSTTRKENEAVCRQSRITAPSGVSAIKVSVGEAGSRALVTSLRRRASFRRR